MLKSCRNIRNPKKETENVPEGVNRNAASRRHEFAHRASGDGIALVANWFSSQ
jgi:hypothetical protein